MKEKIIGIIVIVAIIGGYFMFLNNNDEEKVNYKDFDELSDKINQARENEINLVVGDVELYVTLEKNDTAKALIENIPNEITMNNLNDNEFYSNFNFTMPVTSSIPSEIKKGDLFIYQDNCLVIFYKDVITSYQYTKVGHIDNPEKLDEIIDNSEIKVRIVK